MMPRSWACRRARQIQADAGRFAPGESPAAAKFFFEAHALDQLHGVKEQPVLLAEA